MLRQLLSITIALLLATCASARAEETPPPPPVDWQRLDHVIGAQGERKDDVYTFTLPRSDLNVIIEGMDVPPAAGVASVFHFFRCPCGKIRVVGQFACAEWETNDVIDAIRNGAAIQVASVAPMFVGAKPSVTVVRFQGEGDGVVLAALLKSALQWVGPARSATQPIK
jgi:hypothetical protein